MRASGGRSTRRPSSPRRRRCRRRRTRWWGCTPIRPSWSRSGTAGRGGTEATGRGPVAEITYLEAIRAALIEEMERDPNVFLLGEDIGVYGGAFKVTEGLLARFGEQRVIDTPISEAAIVGAAAGAAHMGLRPVCEMQFIDFISCAYDMLTN